MVLTLTHPERSRVVARAASRLGWRCAECRTRRQVLRALEPPTHEEAALARPSPPAAPSSLRSDGGGGAAGAAPPEQQFVALFAVLSLGSTAEDACWPLLGTLRRWRCFVAVLSDTAASDPRIRLEVRGPPRSSSVVRRPVVPSSRRPVVLSSRRPR